MTNALSAISSTPVAGLGTQSFTLTTAALYTVSFNTFLPYFAAGQPAQSVVPFNQITNITFAADSGGSLNSTYFNFGSAGDLYPFYVWFNINSAGVDPAPTGRIGIQVTGATNATAATLATAAIAAINANASAATVLTASAGVSGHIILTNIQYGSMTAAANGTASPGFTYSITQTGSYGTPAMSGLGVVIQQNSTVLGRYGFPSPTQPLLNGSARFSGAVNDVISVVLSSLSTADAALNSVKSIINLYQGY